MTDEYYRANTASKVIYADERIFVTWATTGRFDSYSARDDSRRDTFWVEGLTHAEAVEIANDYGLAQQELRND